MPPRWGWIILGSWFYKDVAPLALGSLAFCALK
jgi:hypothetical protein